MKKIIPVFLSAILLAMASCGPEKIIFDPASDVFVVVKTVENNNKLDTVYGLALHVFANKGIQNVQVKPNDGSDTTYELSAYSSSPKDFFYQTPDSAFSSTPPFMGDYSFDIIAQSGEVSNMSDRLLDDLIFPTDTMKDSLNSKTSEMVLTWNKIRFADYFVIKMYDTNKEIMFGSPAKDASSATYSFGANTSGWLNGKGPTVGTNYLIEMDTYRLEPGMSGVNIQAKSISTKMITWGN